MKSAYHKDLTQQSWVSNLKILSYCSKNKNIIWKALTSATRQIAVIILMIGLLPSPSQENTHFSLSESDLNRYKAKIAADLNRAGTRPKTSKPAEKLRAQTKRDRHSKKQIDFSRMNRKQREALFHELIVKASARYEVDAALVKAVIMAESSYNPRAVSKVGAQGLMQLMPRTARALGVEDAFCPEHNIEGGVKYLRQLINQFDGDVTLALAAYNAGSRNVRRYNGVPPFKATKIYIRKVFQYYADYKVDMDQRV